MTGWAEYETLGMSPVGGQELTTFQANRLTGRNSDFLAKTERSAPAFLLQTAPTDLHRLPVVLKHLRVTFDVTCRVSTDGETQPPANFCMIECLSDQASVQMSFVLSVESMIATLPVSPTRTQVLERIQAIVETFRRLEAPSAKSLRGLWGELFIIDRAQDPNSFIDAWHDDPLDKFDFALHSDRLEVKTCDSSLRSHEFSLGQLRPANSLDVCIASIELQRSSAGFGVIDMAHRVEKRLDGSPERIAKLWQQVMATLAADEEASAAPKFDPTLAASTLAFFDAASIPCPVVPAGLPITHVRFSITLGPISHLLSCDTQPCVTWSSRLS